MNCREGTLRQQGLCPAYALGALPNRRYAVIVDEAHSSQSGEAAAELRGVLAAGQIQEQARREAEEEGLPDYEEEILRTVKRRGQQPNLCSDHESRAVPSQLRSVEDMATTVGSLSAS